MSRTTTPAKAFGAVAGTLAIGGVLAGCAQAADDSGAAATPEDPTTTSTDEGAASDSPSAAGDYKDGSYSADGSYSSPGGQETIGVEVTLAGGVIESVSIATHGATSQSTSYQQQFADGISSEVVGKSLDDAQVDKVGGSSLTGQGFNAALETIQSDAAA